LRNAGPPNSIVGAVKNEYVEVGGPAPLALFPLLVIAALLGWVR
jgi:hypothetical protein